MRWDQSFIGVGPESNARLILEYQRSGKEHQMIEADMTNNEHAQPRVIYAEPIEESIRISDVLTNVIRPSPPASPRWKRALNFVWDHGPQFLRWANEIRATLEGFSFSRRTVDNRTALRRGCRVTDGLS